MDGKLEGDIVGVDDGDVVVLSVYCLHSASVISGLYPSSQWFVPPFMTKYCGVVDGGTELDGDHVGRGNDDGVNDGTRDLDGLLEEDGDIVEVPISFLFIISMPLALS